MRAYAAAAAAVVVAVAVVSLRAAVVLLAGVSRLVSCELVGATVAEAEEETHERRSSIVLSGKM
jgi:hypothetical protein